MIGFLAKGFTNIYLKLGKINEDEKDIFIYCFDIALSNFLNIFILIILALCTKFYIESLLFELIFITLRGYAGGFHAKTHIGCSLLLLADSLGWVLLISLINTSILNIFSYYFCILSIPFLVIFSPVDNINNLLSYFQKKKYQINCFICLIFVLFVYFLMLEIKKYVYAFVISYSIINICFFMLVQIFINKIIDKI